MDFYALSAPGVNIPFTLSLGRRRPAGPRPSTPSGAALCTVECGEAEPEELLERLRSAPELELAEHSPRRGPVGRG